MGDIHELHGEENEYHAASAAAGAKEVELQVIGGEQGEGKTTKKPAAASPKRADDLEAFEVIDKHNIFPTLSEALKYLQKK